jgi:hypothetical protein
MTNMGIRVRLFLVPDFGPAQKETFYRASLDCWAGHSTESTPAIHLERYETNSHGWDSVSDTQFVRINAHKLDSLTKEKKRNGEYREIYVRDNFSQPDISVYSRGPKSFRIKDPGFPLWVYPKECWEPQTAVFTPPSGHSGKLGAACIRKDERYHIVLFGTTEKGNPWVHVAESKTRADIQTLWSSYSPTGKEKPRARVNLTHEMVDGAWKTTDFGASVYEGAFYGTALFIITTSFGWDSQGKAVLVPMPKVEVKAPTTKQPAQGQGTLKQPAAKQQVVVKRPASLQPTKAKAPQGPQK